jgi:MFS family permease
VHDLLRDPRVRRLLLANVTSSAGAGVTLIAVPWLLIQQPEGSRYYGYVTLGATIALFLFMPYYGAWLDRHARRTMLLAGEAFGFIAMTLMAVWALAAGGSSTGQLMATYFCGMLYSTLHYPARFAFIQETFQPRHYQALTGLSEIQGQTATVLAGAVASVVIGQVALPFLLLANAGTHLFAYLVQRGLPQPTRRGSPKRHRNAWRAMAEGGRWLRERPRLCAFLLCTYVPFVVAMAGNYLFPIYVDRILHANSAVFGRGETLFALGALSAGLLIPCLVPQVGADRTLVATMGLFALGLFLVALFPFTGLYYAAALLLGLGCAGSRVARGAIVLTRVPTEVLGRVQMFFSAFDRLLRTSLIFAATVIVDHFDATLGFGMLASVVIVALAGMMLSRTSIRTAATPAEAQSLV